MSYIRRTLSSYAILYLFAALSPLTDMCGTVLTVDCRKVHRPLIAKYIVRSAVFVLSSALKIYCITHTWATVRASHRVYTDRGPTNLSEVRQLCPDPNRADDIMGIRDQNSLGRLDRAYPLYSGVLWSGSEITSSLKRTKNRGSVAIFGFVTPAGRVLIPLPTYPFWIGASISKVCGYRDGL